MRESHNIELNALIEVLRRRVMASQGQNPQAAHTVLQLSSMGSRTARSALTNARALVLQRRQEALNEVRHILQHGTNRNTAERVLGRLLDLGASPNDINDDDEGVTLLMVASMKLSSHFVRRLLDAGADIHAKDKIGRTALFYACENPDESIGCLLIKRGARVFVKNKFGDYLLYNAAFLGKIDIVNAILRVAGTSVKRLVNLKNDNDNETALMVAAYYGYVEIVRMLIQAGADVNARDNKETVLHYAIVNGSVDVIKLLIQHGARVNAPDRDGLTVLMIASGQGRFPNVVKLLLQYGADIRVRDKQGKTALWYATHSYMKNETIIKILKERV